MHISEVSENHHKTREIWESTVSTFFFKFIFALTFIIPVLLFPLTFAVLISIVWGLSLIVIISCYIAKSDKKKPYRVVMEHLLIAIFVILVTFFIGKWVSTFSNFS
jgi:VIT1/CCC1 family predicted Fe2+/Mn2+ transporter